MVIRFSRSYIVSLVCLALAAAADYGRRVVESIIDFGRMLVAIVALPNQYRFATGMPEGYSDRVGDPLDSALLNSMRHEAGYSKRAAQRHV